MNRIEIANKKGKKLIKQANDVMNRYMQYESDTYQNVAKNRSGTFELNASNHFGIIRGSKDFQGLIENYPNLKANTGVQQSLDEISNNENSISEAKILYNDMVADYNSSIHSFPLNIMCKFMKLTDFDYYSEPEEDIEIVF